jgi:hypothetical protein
MIEPPKLGYYQHRVTGKRYGSIEFNLKCPYDEMDQYDYHDHTGRFVSEEESRENMKKFVRAMFPALEDISDEELTDAMKESLAAVEVIRAELARRQQAVQGTQDE